MHRLSVAQCRQLLAETPPSELRDLIASMRRDARRGVRELAASTLRRMEREDAERQRLARMAELQAELHSRGYMVVAGVDEVGRGALAGPVSAGAVVLPVDVRIDRLNDSKRLTPEIREELAVQIRDVAICWHVAHVSAEEIDTIGIAPATRRAMNLAVSALAPAVDHVMVDGLGVGLGIPETAIVGGDSKVAAIAAASILAKTTRDALMRDLESDYPGYGLALNKGYGTSDHVAAIIAHGASDIHRRSFAPCSDTMSLF